VGKPGEGRSSKACRLIDGLASSLSTRTSSVISPYTWVCNAVQNIFSTSSPTLHLTGGF